MDPHSRLPIRRTVLQLACISALASLLVGCAVQSDISAIQPGAALEGRVHGGQQPVSSASIMLYAAGATGDGTGATNLLAPNIVTTDASGSFSISSDYTCPSATTQVYLVARGGNPGLALGTSNAALVLMAALGNCNSLGGSTFIFVDEVTTAASAWALSQFLGPNAIIGSTPTNATGLANAFAAANNLANTTTGTTPGATLPSSATVETAKLNAFANSLAACVNSDGTAACQPLFSAAGSAPANTLDAALNIVRHPGTNVSAVFNAATASRPFAPALAASPSDWTMSITYGNCTSGCGGLNIPGSVAIDATGSVWVANYFGGDVSKFSSIGIPAAASGLPGAGLNESYGIAIDTAGNAWVTNQQSVAAAGNQHNGSVSKFSSTGTELSGPGYTGGGLYFPQAVAADSNGHMWLADYGSSSATLLANDGSAISGASGYGTSQLPFVSAVALDATHNAWFAAQNGVAEVTSSGTVTNFPCCTGPSGIAIDQSNNIWIADFGGYAIDEMTSAGTIAHQVSTAANLLAPKSLAIDGAGNVWTANYYGNSITQIAGTTATELSPATGFGVDAALSEPYGIAIDASGNLWISNSGNSTLAQFVGLATPIATPLLGPPTAP